MEQTTGSKGWRPDATRSDNYDTTSWSLQRCGWELLRRNGQYRRACKRVAGSERPKELAKLEGPLWGLAKVVSYENAWPEAKQRVVVQLSPTRKVAAYVDRSDTLPDTLKVGLLRPVINIGLAIGDGRALRAQLERITEAADRKTQQLAVELLHCEYRRYPRIALENVGRYLQLLDLAATKPECTNKALGRYLYNGRLRGRALSKQLHKDRAEARYLCRYGFIKFFVAAREASK